MKYPLQKASLSIEDILKIEHTRVYITGRNPDIDQASGIEDLWFNGGIYVPPTIEQAHDLTSDNAGDVGLLRIQGIAESGGKEILNDSTVDFIAAGVAKDDVILNNSTLKYSVVTNVLQTQIEFMGVNERPFFSQGDRYQIVGSASTGASVVLIEFLDRNYNIGAYFKILNGTTKVICDGILRVNQFIVCGASTVENNNIGLLNLTAQIDATITAQISPKEGISSTCTYSVPNGHTAYIASFYGSVVEKNSAGGSLSIKITRFGKAGVNGSFLVRLFDLATAGANHGGREFKPTLKISQLTDISIRCLSVTANNIDIAGNFSIFLVKNA